jgi:hypothetical protein
LPRRSRRGRTPPSPAPYVDGTGDVREVVNSFVSAVLEYDASAESAAALLERVAPITTPRELERLEKSGRARLDWQVLRDRKERVAVTITGISVATTGHVLVEAERTTVTSFATVRDFIQLNLELVRVDGTLTVAHAVGGGL